jgi:hypothetical protein
VSKRQQLLGGSRGGAGASRQVKGGSFNRGSPLQVCSTPSGSVQLQGGAFAASSGAEGSQRGSVTGAAGAEQAARI